MRGEATVRDITFVGVKDPIKAYLVTPTKPGPHAAIVCDNLRRVSPPGTMTRRPSG